MLSRHALPSLSAIILPLGISGLLGGCASLPEPSEDSSPDGPEVSEAVDGELQIDEDDTNMDDTEADDTDAPEPREETVEPSEPSSDDLLLTPEECENLCADRAEQLDDNAHCIFEYSSGDCPTVCEEYGIFERATQEALAECVTENPLCYQDVHDCVARRVYDGPSEAVFRLTGTGFESVSGQTVVMGMETHAGLLTFTREVSDFGRFEVTFAESVFPDPVHLALFYVDVNENGRCDASVDVTGSAYLERSADIDHLSYTAVTGLPERDLDYICRFL